MTDSRPDMPERGPRGVSTVDTGLKLLSLIRDEGEMSAAALAGRSGMSRAQIHAYLASFRECGLLRREAATGCYGMDTLALELGMAHLARMDALGIALQEAQAAAEACGHSISISVWGSYGPTVTAVLPGSQEIRSGASPGTIYSVTGTATGLLFAALLPERMVRAVAEAQGAEPQPRRFVGECPSWNAAADAIAEARRQNLSITYSWPQAGVTAIAAPVRNFSGEVAMAVTMIGEARRIDIAPVGPHAGAIRGLAARISERLGAP